MLGVRCVADTEAPAHSDSEVLAEKKFLGYMYQLSNINLGQGHFRGDGISNTRIIEVNL